MDYICTWFCADEKGEESKFPQTGELSSSQKHQDIYWRCIISFFLTSKKFNPAQKHILFSNLQHLPVVDGINVATLFKEHEIEAVYVPFTYKTPKGYYGKFRNQFYEFSILDYIAGAGYDGNDYHLITDSDCIFLKPVNEVFALAKQSGLLSMRDTLTPGQLVNGLSRLDMQQIYSELLQRPINDLPDYNMGEFYLASVANTRKLSADFGTLWPVLLQRNAQGKLKFNEEAHTLSYLYYKHGFPSGQANRFIKRVWTNPVFYRDAAPGDENLNIWHLPAEKTKGYTPFFKFITGNISSFMAMPAPAYIAIACNMFNIPKLSLPRRAGYYYNSYKKALLKRIKL